MLGCGCGCGRVCAGRGGRAGRAGVWTVGAVRARTSRSKAATSAVRVAKAALAASCSEGCIPHPSEKEECLSTRVLVVVVATADVTASVGSRPNSASRNSAMPAARRPALCTAGKLAVLESFAAPRLNNEAGLKGKTRLRRFRTHFTPSKLTPTGRMTKVEGLLPSPRLYRRALRPASSLTS